MIRTATLAPKLAAARERLAVSVYLGRLGRAETAVRLHDRLRPFNDAPAEDFTGWAERRGRLTARVAFYRTRLARARARLAVELARTGRP